MHRLHVFFRICLLIAALPVFADHQSLVIVTMKTSPLQRLSLDALKRVYLRKSLLDEKGRRWIPLNLPASDSLRVGFSLTLFNKRPEEYENYWNEQYFQGINPPEVMASEEAVLRFIAMTPGAIGYVRKGSVDKRVKILNTLIIAEPH
ncbi:hypothetical protein [Crenothrix polyspora]|uniref:PBP domain-containing protein n=1 Tax=Crenothrix polyspora TaxID=360316 RepID=A0A1R4HCA9_9GAMM|nr:hypothetical protein [Crenothrix polyspora]SJM93892.1 conserved hypothetical protein [Crenothrix polyspora]